MRSLRTLLVVALALGVSGIALAQKPQEKPVPPGLAKKQGAPPVSRRRAGSRPGSRRSSEPRCPRRVKEARKKPARVPPIPPPNVGIALHVVLFE